MPSHVSCIFIRQPKALGLGHAVLCAKPVVGDHPFSVILADDLIDGTPAATKQMADVYARKQCSILGVEDVLPSETASYGIVDAFETVSYTHLDVYKRQMYWERLPNYQKLLKPMMLKT